MSFTKTFLTGVATHMAANGIGVFNPTGIYTPTQNGIVFSLVPQDPPRVITLTAYDVDHDPDQSDTTLGLQVRIRGTEDPTVAEDQADQLFDLFHGAHNYELPSGTTVVQSSSRTRVSGGQDENRRWSTIQNFYFDLWRPSPHRP